MIRSTYRITKCMQVIIICGSQQNATRWSIEHINVRLTINHKAVKSRKPFIVSDMLMGIYLFIIAIEDARFRDNYKEEATTWMSSWPCTLLGALAMTSSEVYTLALYWIPQFSIRNVQLLFNGTLYNDRWRYYPTKSAMSKSILAIR